jgi:hypothetical protein
VPDIVLLLYHQATYGFLGYRNFFQWARYLSQRYCCWGGNERRR